MIQEIYEIIYSTELSRLFANIVGIVFLVSVILSFWGGVQRLPSDEPTTRITSFTPGAMTTLGVLGTFIGIAFGLRNFDVSDIDASVPSLLEGLKVAFGTSIVGMMAALAFRFTEHFGRLLRGLLPNAFPAPDESYQDVGQALSDIRGAIERQTTTIAGDTEGSLLGSKPN